MLYRKKIQSIDDWYKNGSTALLIDGARQVGKSTLIENYLETNNLDYVKFDLIENQDAKEAFNVSRNTEQLFIRLMALSTKELIENKTIIFIDEIQEADDAITPLKYLVQNTKFRFIVSGSLLGIKLKDVRSIPVGYLSTFTLYPLDFEEFMIANSVSSKLIDYLNGCFSNLQDVDPIIHEQLMNLFKTYLVVGGMPAAVNEYVRSKNIQNVQAIHNYIDTLYKQDIAKYKHDEKLLIDDVYDLIPSELNSQNKRFIIKNLNEKARFSKYESSLIWLKDSGVGLFTYNVDNPVYPLLESKERTLFKLFLCDVGLLSTKLYGNTVVRILNKDVDVNYGAIYESYVAQELTAHDYPLFYHNSKKRGEVDFIIEKNASVIPIEVKSGKDYVRHSGLTNLLKDFENIVSTAYVFNNDNFIKVVEKKVYLPIYMTIFIMNKKLLKDNYIYEPDISLLKK